MVLSKILSLNIFISSIYPIHAKSVYEFRYKNSNVSQEQTINKKTLPKEERSYESARDNYARKLKQFNEISGAYNAMGRFIPDEDQGRLNQQKHPGIFSEFQSAFKKAEDVIANYDPQAPVFRHTAQPSARAVRQEMYPTMAKAHREMQEAHAELEKAEKACGKDEHNSSRAENDGVKKPTISHEDKEQSNFQNKNLIVKIILFILEAQRTVCALNSPSDAEQSKKPAQKDWPSSWGNRETQAHYRKDLLISSVGPKKS